MMEKLGQLMLLIIQSGVCPETPKHKWPKIILDAHRLGYLYTNQDLTTAVLAYRVPSLDEKWLKQKPEVESGSILLVGFAVSTNHNKWGLLRMLRSYLAENQIEKI